MDLPQETKKLQEAFASELAKLKQISADCCMPEQQMTQEMANKMLNALAASFHNSLEYLHNRISAVESQFYSYTYEHGKGHLPAIKSASAMQKLLKAAGMENDYEVYKPTIVVASARGPQVSIEYKRPVK